MSDDMVSYFYWITLLLDYIVSVYIHRLPLCLTDGAYFFMATHGKGLICMPMSEEYVEKLKLPQMVENNTDNHETAFTVSIDHLTTTTGISAVERSITALACVKKA